MIEKLKASSIKKLTYDGVKARTGDGGGLWLDVRGPNRAQWVFRYTLQGRAREIGLGSVNAATREDARNSLAAARESAANIRTVLAKGIDPLNARAAVERRDAEAAEREEKARAAAQRTFQLVAEEMLNAHEAGWSNPKHRQQWRNTLNAYAYPVMGAVPVAEVTTEHVLTALQPIWTAKPETASRLRGRIEKVLDFAKARQWRSGENPAAWRGHLKLLLAPPTKLKRVRHQPALPWRHMPAFMAELRRCGGVAARALEFAILTACRSGEVRGMTWGEVDLDRKLWTIPATRMKARREHRVPLCDAAVKLLNAMLPWRENDERSALVFPGVKARQPLSDMSLSAVLRRMLDEAGAPRWVDRHGDQVVPHGFRSTFRDWCAEARSEPREVAEAALAHTLANDTEAAYARSDLFERRAMLMAAWGKFCSGERPQVLALAG